MTGVGLASPYFKANIKYKSMQNKLSKSQVSRLLKAKEKLEMELAARKALEKSK